MELGVVFVIGVLALTAAGLFVYIISLRASLKEAARELDERLKTDTNTIISVSAGDRAVRALAARMNSQLRALREGCSGQGNFETLGSKFRNETEGLLPSPPPKTIIKKRKRKKYD